METSAMNDEARNCASARICGGEVALNPAAATRLRRAPSEQLVVVRMQETSEHYRGNYKQARYLSIASAAH